MVGAIPSRMVANGTFLPSRNVCSMVANGRIADIAPTSNFGSD